MRSRALVACVLIPLGGFAQAVGIPASPATRPQPLYEIPARLLAETAIDRVTFAKFRELRITPANLCSDAVFLRRIYLDLIGTLPTEAEARAFLEDRNPHRRAALIEDLLERDEFVDYWSMKWADLLRIKAEFPINLWPNAVQAYHKWVHTAIAQNMPYDRFARELLTGTGSNFRVPQANFYRAVQSKTPEGLAQAIALTFMGQRTEKWPHERLEAMAAFFSQISYKQTAEWKEEIVFFDPSKPRTAAKPAFPDGTSADIPGCKDPREVFADWLVSPNNSYFAKAIANRAWYWFNGRGIVHEPDDMRADNAPVNPELLALLERELVAGKFDMKRLFRLITNSRTYQLASIAKDTSPAAEANFSSYPLRRLDAEVLIDAIDQITGTSEKYSSPIPEPFTFIPTEQRSIALADGSISSSFLELFGRSPRDNGIEAERPNKPSPSQRLHMLNSSHIQRKIDQSVSNAAFVKGALSRQWVTSMYLRILSRYPTDEEIRTIEEYSKQKVGAGRSAAQDLVWSLLNTAEFLYRH